MTVDTLAIAKELQGAGMDQRQAEAVTKVLGRLAHDDLVTRDYLDVKLAELRADITGLRGDMRTDMAGLRSSVADLRAELIRLMLAQIAIFAGIVALFRFWPS